MFQLFSNGSNRAGVVRLALIIYFLLIENTDRAGGHSTDDSYDNLPCGCCCP